MKTIHGPFVCIALAACSPLAAAIDASHGEGSHSGRLGSVEIPASCSTEVTSYLERGLALLHHMTYEAAEHSFAAAAAIDPDCAFAWWGQAMSYIHPLWSDAPTAQEFRAGAAFVQQARRAAAKSPHDTAYVEAVDAYYSAGANRSESANLAAFAQGWAAAHERFPNDLEIAGFYALALLGAADPADKSYADQKRAAQLAATMLQRSPDHPGAHHYLIHAYDYPAMADRALEVARQYGHIAPDVPHSLHMPTHIFTRLGSWRESIDWNRRSAAAAIDQRVGGAVSMHYLHALDYLAYAHLQLGEDGQAEDVLQTLRALPAPPQVAIATAYTFAAVPARLALERQQWERAAALEPRTPASFPWDRFPAIEAITRYARALGAARSGDLDNARRELQKLSALRDEVAQTSNYWATQVEIQRACAQAWIEKAEGRGRKALATMRAAADLEASTEKHPVTPGEVLPAAELLGDMLMEAGDYAAARIAYDTALARSPNRLNGLYGSARAAELAGDRQAAAERYRELLKLTSTASGLSPVRHARQFLSTQ